MTLEGSLGVKRLYLKNKSDGRKWSLILSYISYKFCSILYLDAFNLSTYVRICLVTEYHCSINNIVDIYYYVIIYVIIIMLCYYVIMYIITLLYIII